MDMFDQPAQVKELIAYATEIASRWLVCTSRLDVISSRWSIHDSQISPEAFREFVTPFAAEFFKAVRDRNTFSSSLCAGRPAQH